MGFSIQKGFQSIKAKTAGAKNVLAGTTTFTNIKKAIQDAKTPAQKKDAFNAFLQMTPKSTLLGSTAQNIISELRTINDELNNSDIGADIKAEVKTHISDCAFEASRDTFSGLMTEIAGITPFIGPVASGLGEVAKLLANTVLFENSRYDTLMGGTAETHETVAGGALTFDRDDAKEMNNELQNDIGKNALQRTMDDFAKGAINFISDNNNV